MSCLIGDNGVFCYAKLLIFAIVLGKFTIPEMSLLPEKKLAIAHSLHLRI